MFGKLNSLKETFMIAVWNLSVYENCLFCIKVLLSIFFKNPSQELDARKCVKTHKSKMTKDRCSMYKLYNFRKKKVFHLFRLLLPTFISRAQNKPPKRKPSNFQFYIKLLCPDLDSFFCLSNSLTSSQTSFLPQIYLIRTSKSQKAETIQNN